MRDTVVRFDEQINDAFIAHIDRWFFCTQLSDVWSRSTSYATYVAELCETRSKLEGVVDSLVIEENMKSLIRKWIIDLETSSEIKIEEMRAYTRREVLGYRNVLWLWNRLDRERWKNAAAAMKRKKAVPKIEVDHAIPVDIWDKLVEEECPLASAWDRETGTELVYPFGIGGMTRSQILSWINAIGNCSLLLRSHNRSKRSEQFGSFLEDIYDADKRAEFSTALSLSRSMLYPLETKITAIMIDVDARTSVIKNQLKDFVRGRLSRVDIA